MSFSMAEVTAAAYEILGVGASDRYPTSRLVVHANNAIRRVAEVFPQPFVVTAWAPLVAGSAEQTVATRKLLVVSAVREDGIEYGLRPLDVDTLSAFVPDWRSADSERPSQVAIDAAELGRFILYPSPAAGIEARVQHVNLPEAYDANATVPLPTTLIPALAEYVAGMAEMADEEHVNSGRAAALLTAFGNSLTAIVGAKRG